MFVHKIIKLSRGATVRVVSIFDSQVKDVDASVEDMPPAGGGNGWELCPVVNMLGVPLAIKKVAPCGCQMCVGSHSSIPESRMQVVSETLPARPPAIPRARKTGRQERGMVY